MLPLSRRSFLVASAAAALGPLVLGACGGDRDDDDDTGGDGPDTTGRNGTDQTGASGDLVLARFFPDGLATTGEAQRLLFGLLKVDGTVVTDPPAELALTFALDGAGDGQQVTAKRRGGDESIARPYYAFELPFSDTGLYYARGAVDSANLEAAFTIVDPATVPIPKPGDPLPPLDTPTVADPRGVDPICTRQPPCPLHDVTLTEALASGKPVAFLIATPAFCQQATCGPVLDILLDEQARRGDAMVFLHAEVYTDDTATATTAVVQAYNMPFEPALFVTDAGGIIRARLDNVYDPEELAAALDLVSA